MKRWLIAVCLMALVSFGAGNGHGGPVDGPTGQSKFRLPGGFIDRVEKVRFEGGKRACVIIVGDHNPVVNLQVEILDEQGRSIAKDEGRGDFAGVVFYPPVTATYTVRLVNPQSEFNECYFVMK